MRELIQYQKTAHIQAALNCSIPGTDRETLREVVHAASVQEALAVGGRLICHVPHDTPSQLQDVVVSLALQLVADQAQHRLQRSHSTT